MYTELEKKMQELAMQQPFEAIKVLGVSAETSPITLQKKFMEAYIEVNGGNPELSISHERVNSATRLWREKRMLEPWVARACVIKQLKKQSIEC